MITFGILNPLIFNVKKSIPKRLPYERSDQARASKGSVLESRRHMADTSVNVANDPAQQRSAA
jgi:hypothetical protein